MKMLKNWFLLLSVFILSFGSAKGQLINIEDCYRLAKENYPMLKQYNLIAKTKEFDISNANKAYLPQLTLIGRASYQSDVTKIAISVPGVETPTPSKDQYIAQLNLEQTIWDGGVISSQKKITEATARVSQNQLDVEMYTIRERINNLFFGILLLDAQAEQLKLHMEDLQRTHTKIENYIHNGVGNQSDLDVVRVEMLKVEQQDLRIEFSRKAYTKILSLFIGENLSDDVKLIKPNIETYLLSEEINSPEISLFSAQYDKLESQKNVTKSSYMPKFSLFAQGGYGRPGLNMLRSDFRPFYMAGINLAWNISSLYTSGNQRKLITINQELVLNQKEIFLFNKKMEISQEQIAIEQQRKLLERDNEIIRLRENVKKTAQLKLDNGTITISDLMQEVIAENLARQEKNLHEAELLQAIYKLKYTTNN